MLHTWETAHFLPDIKVHTHTKKEYKSMVEMRAPCPLDVLSEAASGTNLPTAGMTERGSSVILSHGDKEVLQIFSKRPLIHLWAFFLVSSQLQFRTLLFTINRHSLMPGGAHG